MGGERERTPLARRKLFPSRERRGGRSRKIEKWRERERVSEEEEEEERKSPSLPYARTHARGREGEKEERLGERRRGRNGIWRERGERERKEKERVRRERGEEFPPA